MKRVEKGYFKRFDYLTLILIVALLIMGILAMLNSLADPSSGDMTLGAKLASLNLYYPLLQLAWFAVGLAAVVFITMMDYQVVGHYVKIAYAAILFLLVLLVLFGESTRGVTGWFSIGSTRALQPSEFGKIVIMLMVAKICADSMDRNEGRLKGVKDIGKTILITLCPVALVAVQPDWGTAMVYICILIGMLFAARMSWKVIGITTIGGIGAMPLVYYFVLNDDQRTRILTYLNPNADVLNEAYHANAGLEVIKSGGAFGNGFLADGSLTQLGYLPENHTDYIFASLVEVFGFVGGVILILLYFALIIRTLYIGQKSKDNFGMLICAGVASMMFAHVFENIGMLIGLMPITGIPLPFVSYGGSNLLANMMAYGFVINVWMRRQQNRKSPVRMAIITG